MLFYGFQKTTLIDFPGEVASLLFTAGCNFRCPYCHNPELVLNTQNLNPLAWDEIFTYLKKRRNLLGGVCITGGEPLLNTDLKYICQQIQGLNLKVKIDTNGSFPERLKNLTPDYIAMDIKTAFNKYKMVGYIGNDDIASSIGESIEWIIHSKIPHEFRTTVVPYIVTLDDIKEITQVIKGAQKYFLTSFRSLVTLDPDWQEIRPYPSYILEEMKKTVNDAGVFCEIR